MENFLFEEFSRRYKITGASSSVKQIYRLINHFLEFVTHKYPYVKKIEMINQDHRNAFYRYLKKKGQQGKISKSYIKDYLYAANKLFKEIGKPELCYDVSKILKSFESIKTIDVTLEEFNNIKTCRRKYGKVIVP
ncbi:MAG: hypothetical protein FXF54_14440 [Kosmotoga sp.]|nr:MAG: hypothetical protein FXF54_14440 [Kosmotoga sp.]